MRRSSLKNNPGRRASIRRNSILDDPTMKNLRSTYFVDSELGPYKTIQEAVNASDPNSLIKISPGLYQENILPGLRFEPSDKFAGDVVIFVSSKPAFLIDIPFNEKCTLSGIKVSHSGLNEENEDFNIEEGENLLQNFFKLSKTDAYNNLNPEKELINVITIEETMNCAILVNRGTLLIEDCFLILKCTTKNKTTLPALILNDNTELIANRIEIRSNRKFDTIGIGVRKANMIIKDSKIQGHHKGGIHIWSDVHKTIKISNCKVNNNDDFGIIIVGSGYPIIENSKIENNFGDGIKVGIDSKVKIIRNSIRHNRNGIDIISAEPYIFYNKIIKNHGEGIKTQCHLDLRCDAVIKFNEISGNRENGVICIGKENFSRIEQNVYIGYNKRAGVKADEGAHIVIHKNNISKNFQQGILLAETSSAVIERNYINSNIKANLAYGGNRSVDTLVVENIISGGCSEGIFLVEGGDSWIFRNTITSNNNGIVCMTCVPEISKNSISGNKSTGIMVLKGAIPNIHDNLVTDNDGIGIYIRDSSKGSLKNNIVPRILILDN